jgi:hypothetical protein
MRFLGAAAVLTAVFACPCLYDGIGVSAAQSGRGINPDDASFYRVPLMCSAVRGLGCGTRAKPVLLDLQRKSVVREAWLNDAGDVLAVVWTGGSSGDDRESAAKVTAAAHDVSMDLLAGAARDAAAVSFGSGAGWHRGTDVDRLSEREAQVISDRLLRRVSTAAPSARTRISTVAPVLTEAIRGFLVNGCSSLERCRDALLAEAGKYFSAPELDALRTAIQRGLEPVGDEH